MNSQLEHQPSHLASAGAPPNSIEVATADFQFRSVAINLFGRARDEDHRRGRAAGRCQGMVQKAGST